MWKLIMGRESGQRTKSNQQTVESITQQKTNHKTGYKLNRFSALLQFSRIYDSRSGMWNGEMHEM